MFLFYYIFQILITRGSGLRPMMGPAKSLRLVRTPSLTQRTSGEVHQAGKLDTIYPGGMQDESRSAALALRGISQATQTRRHYGAGACCNNHHHSVAARRVKSIIKYKKSDSQARETMQRISCRREHQRNNASSNPKKQSGRARQGS